MEQLYTGSCHCGAVKFEAKVDLAEAFTCNCSLCSKKNAVIARIPEDSFKLVEGEEHLELYQWNTKRAKHYFCKACGIYTFHRPRSAPEKYAINIACLDGVDARSLDVPTLDGAALSLES